MFAEVARQGRVLFALTAVAVAFIALPAAVQAQAPSSGPLVLTPIPSSVVFSPSVEVTTVNHDTATVIGGYLGNLTDHSLLFGGGLYWLANPRDNAQMTYLGVVLGWRGHSGDRLDVGVQGLLGGGWVTVFWNTTAIPLDGHGVRPLDRIGVPIRFGASADFLLALPEAQVGVALTRGMRVEGSVGYRATSADHGFGELLNGVTGGVSVEFSFGS